jgi:pentatricopeptide repeat protein
MRENGEEPNLQVCNALLKAYAKSGRYAEATRLLKTLNHSAVAGHGPAPDILR